MKGIASCLGHFTLQKEYPVQLDKKFESFRACEDAVEKKNCLLIAGINPLIRWTSKSWTTDQSLFTVATIPHSLLLE
jgi:hypothetical protein